MAEARNRARARFGFITLLGAERLLQICDEIFWVLEPDRKANEIGRNSGSETGLLGHRRVRHSPRILDQRLYPAERFSEGKDADTSEQACDALFTPGEPDGKRAAETRELLVRKRVRRVRGKARMQYGTHGRLLLEPASNRQG